MHSVQHYFYYCNAKVHHLHIKRLLTYLTIPGNWMISNM